MLSGEILAYNADILCLQVCTPNTTDLELLMTLITGSRQVRRPLTRYRIPIRPCVCLWT